MLREADLQGQFKRSGVTHPHSAVLQPLPTQAGNCRPACGGRPFLPAFSPFLNNSGPPCPWAQLLLLVLLTFAAAPSQQSSRRCIMVPSPKSLFCLTAADLMSAP